MPLSREEFFELRRRGLSAQQIARFEAGVKPGKDEPKGASTFERILSTLPSVGAGLGGVGGGFFGGMAGGVGAIPGALGGAALGGAAGRITEQAVRRGMGLPERPAEFMGMEIPQALDVPAEALGQAGLEAAGLGIGGAMSRIARPLAERAIRVPQLIARGTVTRPQLRRTAELAMKERIPIGGRGQETGAEIAIGKARTSGKELNRLLKEAEQSGASLDASDLTREVAGLLDEIVDQPLVSGDLRIINIKFQKFLADHPGPLTPTKVKLLKRRAQELAAPIIKRRKVRPGISAKEALSARFNDAIARGARRVLEEIPTPIPGARGRTFGQAIGERERQTANLIDLADQLRRAEASTSGVTLSPFGPFRPLGAMTPSVRLTRPTASRIALGLTAPAVQAATRQTPRGLEALLEQALLEEGGELP